MKHHLTFFSTLLFITSLLYATPQEFLNKYCISCHGVDKQKGKLRLDQFDSSNLKLITNIVEQLEDQEMPPEDEVQPTHSEIRHFIKSLQPKQQTTPSLTQRSDFFRRFNSVEYKTTVMNLLELPKTTLKPTLSFPNDNNHEGSNKQWDHLTTSEFLLQSLIESADLLIEKAITFKDKPPAQKWSSLPLAQMHFETKNKKRTGYIHLFNKDYYSYLPKMREGVPHDGYYEIVVEAQSMYRRNQYQKFTKLDPDVPAQLGLSSSSLQYGPNLHRPQNGSTQLAVNILKGNRLNTIKNKIWLYKGDVPRVNYDNGVLDWRMSGFRIIEAQGVSYKNEHIPSTEYKGDRTISFFPQIISEEEYPKIKISNMSIEGPLYKNWPPKSHSKWFGKKGKFTSEESWKAILKFSREAFRRPINKFEEENFKTVLNESITRGESLEQATKEVFKTILCMPDFLYLFLNPDQSVEKKIQERLSTFLWSQPYEPRNTKTSLQERVIEMLDDDRSWNFIKGFLSDWLKLDTLGQMAPDKSLFPTFYIDNLKVAMQKETELLFAYCLRNNLSIENLIDNDFSFVNKDLCRHYGIDPSGIDWRHLPDGLKDSDLFLKGKLPSRESRFAKVKLFDRRRGGILGHASILTLTANGTDTNPILRGVWFLEAILGQTPKLPDQDVPELEPDIRGSQTVREQFKKHRESPQCASCHNKIDPPGYVLESFDPIGRWRNIYPQTKHPVESFGHLYGKEFKDIVEFKKILLTKKDVLTRTIVEKMMIYALGRDLTGYDSEAIYHIIQNVKAKGYGLKDILLEITASPLFHEI